jgi:hypothetical protein
MTKSEVRAVSLITTIKNKIGTKYIKLANMNVWFGLDCHGIIKFGEYETNRTRVARFHNLIYVEKSGYSRKKGYDLQYLGIRRLSGRGVQKTAFSDPF